MLFLHQTWPSLVRIEGSIGLGQAWEFIFDCNFFYIQFHHRIYHFVSSIPLGGTGSLLFISGEACRNYHSSFSKNLGHNDAMCTDIRTRGIQCLEFSKLYNRDGLCFIPQTSLVIFCIFGCMGICSVGQASKIKIIPNINIESSNK